MGIESDVLWGYDLGFGPWPYVMGGWGGGRGGRGGGGSPNKPLKPLILFGLPAPMNMGAHSVGVGVA